MRIGNLFERDGNILEVVRISKDGTINYEVVEKNKGQYVNSGVVRPIKITEDWLIRLGFNKIGGTHYLNIGSIEIGTIKNNNRLRFYIQLRTDNVTLDIQFVHQLQNLYFALTNTELCTSK